MQGSWLTGGASGCSGKAGELKGLGNAVPRGNVRPVCRVWLCGKLWAEDECLVRVSSLPGWPVFCLALLCRHQWNV